VLGNFTRWSAVVMVCISRAANRMKHPKVQRLGYTEDELCAALDISKSLFERMKRKGLGPRGMKLGSKTTRYSPEAAAEWVKMLEKANNRSNADAA
jgi:predicted DNA-binding transcriptional regulator AlpA